MGHFRLHDWVLGHRNSTTLLSGTLDILFFMKDKNVFDKVAFIMLSRNINTHVSEYIIFNISNDFTIIC